MPWRSITADSGQAQSILEEMKQNSTNGYVHEQALAAILRMPTDTANSPVALIDVHTLRVT